MNTLRDLADSVEACAAERGLLRTPPKRDGHVSHSDVLDPPMFAVQHDGRRYEVDTVTAALALLLDDPCPDCVARGGRWEWSAHVVGIWYRDGLDASALGWRQEHADKQGWRRLALVVDGLALWLAARPCQRCSRHLTDTDVSRPGSPARLVCEAMPRELVGRTSTSRWPGSTAARDALAVLADQFQAAGDPRGLWLALWLSGAECKRCDGDGHTSLTLNLYGGRTQNPCSTCHGLGIAPRRARPGDGRGARRLSGGGRVTLDRKAGFSTVDLARRSPRNNPATRRFTSHEPTAVPAHN